ncbi:hypothetical protein CFC21_087706 [Triticum aestivum]|uniref:DUF632 domain-containing protein n=3 Tax=Triticum TaxID=4564 RepID=A0A9R0YIY5_TRITD|nr:protein ALTERED PHOSPHATE STARVATION RESPONSE 1-like [Triticum aestivum]KAF7083997.1 hypothetical protein CFC21_087706 [Triticum aestivum]VAI56305.1 unnamed protein product [Triticum turgidum subsp. durum]
MGCSSSKKLDEEEAVKTCHDRRSFVKKAIAQRDLLASSHVAYLQSLRRVSLALFYCLAEDEHLYFLQDTSAQCTHRPCSPEKRAVLLVVNRLRPGGAPVHPLVGRWDGEAGAAEAAVVDGFFGVDTRLFRPPANDVPVSSPSHLPSAWDVFWVDPFSSLPTDHVGYANHGVQEMVNADQEDGEMPELEEISEDGSNGEGESKEEEAPRHEVVVEPRERKEKKKVAGVSNKLRVRASAEVEQQSTPGRFTVFVDRPPASVAEAMRDIKGHFSKIAETAGEVSVLLEVVPYQKKVQPPAPRGDVDGDDGGERVGAREPSPEPFQLFQSHKESLDRLYAWEKKLYEEVRAGERVRLSYEKKVAQLRSQDANGAEPFAIERTRAAIRDLRTKLNISLASVDAVSRRIVAVRDDELLPQLAELIRGLARMWRVIGDAHRVMKRTADEASALLSSSAAGAEGGIRGPPPLSGPTRAATAAGALATELRGWRAALEAWAESQRGYAAALWGWARSCVKDGEDMPRLIVAWARAVEAVDVDAATRAVEGVAAEAAAIAAAARRRSSSAEEEPPNEEEGKRRVCVGLAAALGAIAEAGSLASAAYGELVAEMDEREREAEMAGRDDEPSIQNNPP